MAWEAHRPLSVAGNERKRKGREKEGGGDACVQREAEEGAISRTHTMLTCTHTLTFDTCTHTHCPAAHTPTPPLLSAHPYRTTTPSQTQSHIYTHAPATRTRENGEVLARGVNAREGAHSTRRNSHSVGGAVAQSTEAAKRDGSVRGELRE